MKKNFKHLAFFIIFILSLLLFRRLDQQGRRFRSDELLPEGREGAWYQGDTHCHTEHSDAGLARFFPLLPADVTVRSQVQRASGRRLNFLMINDHRTLAHLYDRYFARPPKNVLLIPSEEWGIDVHASIWGIEDEIENIANVEGTRFAKEMAHAQGGLIAMAHPARKKKSWFLKGKEHYKVEGIDAIEIWSGGRFGNFMSSNAAAVRFWEREFLNRGKKIVGVGASDNHVAQVNVLGGVGYPTTVVFAPELTAAGILDGIQKGHVYIKSGRTDIALTFEADSDGDGVYETLMGETAAAVSGKPMDFRIRAKRAKGMTVNLVIQNGLVLSEKVRSSDDILHFQIKPQFSWYRIEVLRYGRLMEAMTNPIYLVP